MVPDSRRRAMRLNDRQWAGMLLFVGTAQYLIIGLIIAFSAILTMRVVRPPFQFISVILGVISLIALGLYISKTYLGLGPGGMERMIVYPIAVWGLAFGGYLFGMSPSSNGASVPS